MLCIVVTREMAKSYSLFLLVAYTTLLASTNCATSQYSIAKSVNDCTCCSPKCFTLSDLATKSSQLLSDNSHLIFAPGTHILALNFTVSDKSILKMVSNSSSQHVQVIIKCNENSSLYFFNCTSVNIIGIKFVGCGNNRIRKVPDFMLQSLTFEGQNNSGTAVELVESTAHIYDSVFTSNTGIHAVIQDKICFDTSIGGALVAKHSNLTIRHSQFYHNQAAIGGVIYLNNSNAVIGSCNFSNNEAKGETIQCDSQSIFTTVKVSITAAGAICLIESNVEIANCHFQNNSALFGGVIFTLRAILSVKNQSTFLDNIAWRSGGVIHSEVSTITLTGPETLLDGNLAIAIGGVASFYITSVTIGNNVLMTNNSGEHGSVFYAFNSSVAFYNESLNISSNAAPNIKTGVITLYQSHLIFFGKCNFEHNKAENGAVIYSVYSRINIVGAIMVSNNRARNNGGAFLLHQSELICQENSTLSMIENVALKKGGAIYAVESTLKMILAWTYKTILTIQNNSATAGGGLYLEGGAKMYMVKYSDSHTELVNFSGNVADYGGAVYVNDDTNSAACTRDNIECFIQELNLFGFVGLDEAGNSIIFEHNHARVQGSNLFGGLLHRCTIIPFIAVARATYTNATQDGLSYYKTITRNISNKISSLPIDVCQCTIDERPNCITKHTHHSSYKVKKGETISVSLVAVDQVGHPVAATIQILLSSNQSGLLEGQLMRSISAKCTNLNFNVVSPEGSEKLSLFASNGPCRSAESASLIVDVIFLPCTCPVGFQNSENSDVNCTCECHIDIVPYVSRCDIHTQSFVKLPHVKAWIGSSLFNNTSGFIIYPNCPFDYCIFNQNVSINLNVPDGTDAQCAYRRSALLCGSCQSGLSLSLGSSQCVECPPHWPALFVTITLSAIIAGILLVTAILMLNMTVAVGTLNGLIFYANILSTGRSVLLPLQEDNHLKFANILVSWLNMDSGIDVCYIDGIDTYTKWWLQLAFPAYVFILVAAIILVSSRSVKFSNLLGKKNPVAALSTLIMLSYAKILQVAFRALLPGIVAYPGSSTEIVWLPDANIKYFSFKHCILLITSMIIIFIGLIYTILIFTWQWLHHLLKWRTFRWIGNQKLHAFIETYNIPYRTKHRYWTGMLLLARVFLNLRSLVNFSNKPQDILSSIIVLVGAIFFLKALIGGRLYRNKFIDIVETIIYFNILAFASLTWYGIDNQNDLYHSIIAYFSVTVSIILMLLIILYHLYVYTPVFLKIHKTAIGQKLSAKLLALQEPVILQQSASSPNVCCNINEILEAVDRPVNEYKQTSIATRHHRAKPTHSSVIIHNPYPNLPPPQCKGVCTTTSRQADTGNGFEKRDTEQ